MKIPTVSHCCCGVELRTAGLIFGALGIIFVTIEIIDDDLWWKRVYLSIIVIFELLWIAGILKEKPNWMLPSLVSNLIELVVLLVSPLYLPIFTKYFIPEFYDFLQKYEEHYAAAYVTVSIMIYITLGISGYFFIVCYSLYKQMKDKLADDQNAQNSMRFDA